MMAVRPGTHEHTERTKLRLSSETDVWLCRETPVAYCATASGCFQFEVIVVCGCIGMPSVLLPISPTRENNR